MSRAPLFAAVLLLLWLGVWFYPVSTSLTRTTGLALAGLFLLALLAWAWPQRLARFAFLGALVLVGSPGTELEFAL